MKNQLIFKLKKILIVIGLLAFMLSPLYSMKENNGGFIWEIVLEECISCNNCYETAPDFITLDGNDDPYFTNGNIIGGSSILLQYSYPENPDLEAAYQSCPLIDIAFKKDTY